MSDGVRFAWHAEQWRRLSAARSAGRLPHALLLAGPPGVGKAGFARRLADALVCTAVDPAGDACGRCSACRQAGAGSHPDQRWVSPEEAGRPIKIAAIRDLTAQSVLAAQAGGHRVFVLDPAEAMNAAAANALLKTLEEPVSRSVLILVSSHPDRLAATIRSRCQLVRFGMPPAAEVRDWLAGRVQTTALDELLAISGGAPLRALRAAEEDWVGQGRQLVAELDRLKRRRGNPLQTVEEWEKRSLTPVLEGLKRCVCDLVRLARLGAGTAIYHPGSRKELQNLSSDIDLKSLFRFNDELLQIERALSRNLNPQMVLESVANRWLQMTRTGGQ